MLFRKKIERSCSYCRYCTVLDEEQYLCSKKGIRFLDQSCWRFKYDPFKRIPVKAKPLGFKQFDENDYSL